MAYTLRYYYESRLNEGRAIRLEIHEKDGQKEAMPIGDIVQGLSLEIQGSEADVIAPIVTTALTMTFVDAPDLPEADTHKCGNWEEFYTPDSTYWKVVLLARDSDAEEFRAIWGGYVTPDSYEEELRYRGFVTIVARDNIGLLKEMIIPKDYPLRVLSLSQLLGLTWSLTQSPMQLQFNAASTNKQYLESGGVSALDTFFSISSLEDKSWYDALENMLDSHGLCLRYVGDNIVSVSTLRDYPRQNKADYDAVPRVTPVFVSGATRMLTPAVKAIEEEVNYESEESEVKQVTQEDYTGERSNGWVSGNTASSDLYCFYINEYEAGSGWCNPAEPLFFNPHEYSFFNDADNDKQYMFLACNSYRDVDTFLRARYAEYSETITAADVTFQLEMGESYSFDINDKLRIFSAYQGYKDAIMQVYIQQNGITQYLQNNGSWGTDETLLTITPSGNKFELPIYMGDYTGEVLLGVRIYSIHDNGAASSVACYAPVRKASFTLLKGLLGRNKVTTIFNEKNNLILHRSPMYGPMMDKAAFPMMIPNSFFIKENGWNPARAWNWPNDEVSQPQQMAVYNHLQILCYYTKPNNVLEGTIVNADVTRPACIYEWKGAEHLLVGGRFNLLNGFIEGAILREFARYEEQVFVNVTRHSAMVSKAGEVLDVKVMAWSMIEWEVSGLPSWITASKTSGKGEDTIQLTIAANETGEVRTAVVTIGNAAITITQKNRMGDFSVDFSLDYL